MEMGQVTIYFDDETETRVKASAKQRGLSVSRWVTELVREKTQTEWPDEIRRLAGAWADLPEVEQLREAQGEDLTREPF
jgi:hypothetical protein